MSVSGRRNLPRQSSASGGPGGFLSAVGQRLFRCPRAPREATVFFVFSRFGKFTTTGRTLAALVTAAPFCPPLTRVRRQIRYATFGAQATWRARLCPHRTASVRPWPPAARQSKQRPWRTRSAFVRRHAFFHVRLVVEC